MRALRNDLQTSFSKSCVPKKRLWAIAVPAHPKPKPQDRVPAPKPLLTLIRKGDASIARSLQVRFSRPVFKCPCFKSAFKSGSSSPLFNSVVRRPRKQLRLLAAGGGQAPAGPRMSSAAVEKRA